MHGIVVISFDSLFSFHSLLTSTYIIHFPYYNSVCIEPNICVCVCVWRYKSRGASYVWSSKVYPTVLCLCLPRCLQYFLMPSLFFLFFFPESGKWCWCWNHTHVRKNGCWKCKQKNAPPQRISDLQGGSSLVFCAGFFLLRALFCCFTLLFWKAFRCGFRSFFSFLAFLSPPFS